MRQLFILIFLLGLFACGRKSEYSGFTRLDESLHYKLIALGEEERSVRDAGFVTFSVLFKTFEDSLIAMKRFERIKPSEISGEGVIKSALMECNEGDSILFVANAKDWNLPSLNMNIDLADSVPVLADISVHKTYSPTEMKTWKKERDLLRDLELKEQDVLQQLLDSLGFQRAGHQDYTYVKILRQGKGKIPENGDYVVAEYKASFSNGNVFDNTYNGNSLEFMLGKPDQVLPGFATGISKMREGGKAVFIIPSIVGFGEKGSSSGIVPPYTTLIYEVELKEVRKT